MSKEELQEYLKDLIRVAKEYSRLRDQIDQFACDVYDKPGYRCVFRASDNLESALSEIKQEMQTIYWQIQEM